MSAGEIRFGDMDNLPPMERRGVTTTWTQHGVGSLTPYQCTVCGEWWLRPAVAVSCCVQHSPGTCCHFGDVKPD